MSHLQYVALEYVNSGQTIDNLHAVYQEMVTHLTTLDIG